MGIFPHSFRSVVCVLLVFMHPLSSFDVEMMQETRPADDFASTLTGGGVPTGVNLRVDPGFLLSGRM